MIFWRNYALYLSYTGSKCRSCVLREKRTCFWCAVSTQGWVESHTMNFIRGGEKKEKFYWNTTPLANTEVRFCQWGIPRFKWILCNILGNALYEKLLFGGRGSIWHKYINWTLADLSYCLLSIFYFINMFTNTSTPSYFDDFALIYESVY